MAFPPRGFVPSFFLRVRVCRLAPSKAYFPSLGLSRHQLVCGWPSLGACRFSFRDCRLAPSKAYFPSLGLSRHQLACGWPSLGAWPLQKLIVPFPAASMEFWLSTFPCHVQWHFLPGALPQAFSYASETAAWPLQRLISHPWAFPGISWLVAGLPWAPGRFKKLIVPFPAASNGLTACPSLKFWLPLPRPVAFPPRGFAPSFFLRFRDCRLAPSKAYFPSLGLSRHQLACGLPWAPGRFKSL